MRFAMALTLCGLCAFADVPAQTLRTNPAELPPAKGYSHVVIAPAGQRVVISGQVGLDAKGNLAGEDFEKQCIQAHENVKAALASVGLTFSDVIRTDNYITDRKYLSILRKVRSQYIPSEQPPASTLLVVDGLFRPELLVEISVEAVMPSK